MGDSVPEAFRNQILYVTAQVLFSKKNYREALSYAQRWIKTQREPTADGHLLIGHAYYQLKEYDRALSKVIDAIKKRTSAGNVSKEGTLNLLSAIYRETGQLEKTIPVIKQLIKHYTMGAYQLTLDKVREELSNSKK